MDGLSLIKTLNQEHRNIKTIIISAFVSPQDLQEIIENNDLILGFLSKPIYNIEQLKNIVQINLGLPEVKIVSNFNYESLEPQDHDFIQQKTGEIKSLIKLSTQTIVEIGSKLIEVKGKLKHGQFGDWLKLEFDWSEPTAQRFMRVARKFKSVNLTNLAIVPSALYLLAASSIPDDARTEALQRAKKGESINYKKAKQIKAKYLKKDEVKVKTEQSPEKILLSAESQQSHKNQESSLPIIAQQQSINTPSKELNSPVGQSSEINADSWWRLGKEHLLYCGDPQSENFKKSFPKKIDLSLAFPNQFNWRLELSQKVNSELVFYSQYQDIDLNTLRKSIENLLLLYTEDESTIIFSFLPDPQLILLADRLKCICRIAEPNLQRCQEILATFQNQGLQVAKLI